MSLARNGVWPLVNAKECTHLGLGQWGTGRCFLTNPLCPGSFKALCDITAFVVESNSNGKKVTKKKVEVAEGRQTDRLRLGGLWHLPQCSAPWSPSLAIPKAVEGPEPCGV